MEGNNDKSRTNEMETNMQHRNSAKATAGSLKRLIKLIDLQKDCKRIRRGRKRRVGRKKREEEK